MRAALLRCDLQQSRSSSCFCRLSHFVFCSGSGGWVVSSGRMRAGVRFSVAVCNKSRPLSCLYTPSQRDARREILKVWWLGCRLLSAARAFISKYTQRQRSSAGLVGSACSDRFGKPMMAQLRSLRFSPLAVF